MELKPGVLLDGTVRSITDFGAFVVLPNGQSGLIHISEVADSYVKDIRSHLSEGQPVHVKVLNIDDRGRISLSLRQAQARAAQAEARPAVEKRALAESQPRPQAPVNDSFEDKLKRFMTASNDKISGVRQYEHKTRSRKR